MAGAKDGERKLDGRVVFGVVDRMHYGFDVFTVDLPAHKDAANTNLNQKRLTDGKSVNYNAQFVETADVKLAAVLHNHVFAGSEKKIGELDEKSEAVVFISERSKSARIHLNLGLKHDDGITTRITLGPLRGPGGFFFDRPIMKNGKVFFVCAQEPADKPLKSWSAVHSTCLKTGATVRLTPPGMADFSPSISPSGKWMMVASYGGDRRWEMSNIEDLEADLYIFKAEDGSARRMVAERGGWPTWADENTVYFHRRAEDGWWSIYRLTLPTSSDFEELGHLSVAERITPPSLHAFTPCASRGCTWIALATRRPETKFRHIEIFDLKSSSFISITSSTNPEMHHYNPFLSSDSQKLGFHRYRGEENAHDADTIVPFLESIESPLPKLKLQRVNGFFPAFSPDGSLIAFNPRLGEIGGVHVVRADGSKRWKLFDGPAFAVAWNRKQKGTVYASLGPIFAPDKTTVHIILIRFDPEELKSSAEEEKPKPEVKILTKDGTNNNAFPFSSPDGREIVFRSGRSGHKNLYIMDAEQGEGAGIRRLTEGPWIDTMPCWSPDGEWIAFSSNRDDPSQNTYFSLYMIHPDGSGLHRVRGGDRERINHVCFSPNSDSLLFTANLGGVSAEPVSLPNQFQPYGELFVSALDGSDVQRLTFNAYENGTPTWHTDCHDDGLDLETLSLGGKETAGVKLKGEFIEPLWLAKPTSQEN